MFAASLLFGRQEGMWSVKTCFTNAKGSQPITGSNSRKLGRLNKNGNKMQAEMADFDPGFCSFAVFVNSRE